MPEDRPPVQLSVPQRLFRNFTMLFAANVLGQVLLLLAMVHLARVVGPAGFGAWGFAQAWMMYLFRIGELGLEVTGIRTIATSSGDRARTTAWNVLAVRVLLAGIMILAVAAAVALGAFPEGSGELLLVFSLAVIPVAVVLEWVFEAHQQIPVVGFARILKGVLFGALVLLLVRGANQIVEAAWFYVASLVIPSGLVFVIAMRRYHLMPPTFVWPELRVLVKEALPIGVATILWQVTLFIGTVLGGYLTSPERLGYYTAGHRLIIFVWAYGIVSSNRVILPQLSRLFGKSTEEFAEFVKKYFRMLALVAFPVIACGVAGGPAIIRLLYGDAYAEGAMVFQVLALALGVAVISSVLEVGLIAAHRQRAYMNGMIGQVVLYSILTVIGLKVWDIAGAAWAAVAAEFCYATYLLLVFRYVSIRQLLMVCIKPVLASAAVLGVFLVAGVDSLPIIVAGGLIGYPLILFLVGELTRADVDTMVRMVSGRRAIS